jgi:choline monooxygenase
MTDLSLQNRLTALSSSDQRTSPLPVSLYSDEAVFAAEQRAIFERSPRYAGHMLSVPRVGDYVALPQEGEGRVLMRTPKGIELISNICRHRQAVMLRGRGNNASGNIICPLHRWTYDASGQQATGTLIGAPHFKQDPCLHLKNYPLQQWHGLLFDTSHVPELDIRSQLQGIQAANELNFEGYVFDRAIVHECNYNWKTFVEVYLEDYHVGPFHPGLGHFVTCDDLKWEYGKEWSVQTVGANAALSKPGSKVYERWHQAVLSRTGGKAPAHGAIWFTYYPTVMVEWYPEVLTVSCLYPVNPHKTINIVEFFYPEEIHAFEREFIDAQQAAYMETCAEDDEIALRMDAGRKALTQRGVQESGPYQSPMEDGMVHFHEWYLSKMNAAS